MHMLTNCLAMTELNPSGPRDYNIMVMVMKVGHACQVNSFVDRPVKVEETKGSVM